MRNRANRLVFLVGVVGVAWAFWPNGALADSSRGKADARKSAVDSNRKSADKKRTKQGAKPQHGAHRKGRAPKEPAVKMPDGAPRAKPDAYARQGIAAGKVRGGAGAGLDDRELRLLREAERVLFPDLPFGLVPGAAWDVSHPVGDGSPSTDTTGLSAFGVDGYQPRDSVATEAWVRTLVKPDIDVRFERRVVKYLEFYRDNPRGRAIAEAWVKKSGRLAPSIRSMLTKAGLPTDLVWLSLVESGHNPSIKSPAGAAGLWQFIPSTARMYGLTVDRWVDERLDPRRATEAAILLLSDLHQRFGNWPLAMAAYNMGYGGLSRAIRKYNTNDFFELTRFEAGVPWETSLYVSKIMATALMMNNKPTFSLAEIEQDEAERFDTIYVESGTPLRKIADGASISTEELQSLNAQFLAERIPPAAESDATRTWRVRLPKGKGPQALKRLARTGGSEAGLATVVVRFGDTVGSIASSTGCDAETLRKINKINLREELRPGTVLLTRKSATAPKGERATVVVPPRMVGAANRRRVFYKVAAGDSLADVANALGLGTDALLEQNALDSSARLQPGMVLQAYVDSEAKLDGVRHFTDRNARVFVAGTVPFFDHFEELNGKRRFVVVAKEGDTLASLGKRHGLSVGSMERINRRSRYDKLEAGDKLVVYSQRAAGKAERAKEVASVPLAPVSEPKPEGSPSPAQAGGSKPD